MRPLKPKHWQVAKFAALGFTSKEISTKTGLNPNTIDNLRLVVFHYFGVHNCVELAHKFLHLKLIENKFNNEPFTSN